MTEAGSGRVDGSGVEDGYVTLGLVSRAHGVHGAVVVRPLTENFALLDGAGLELWSPDGRERRPAESLKARSAEQGLIIKFPGLTTREEATALKGWRLVLPRALLPPLPDDEIYWADLVGLMVSTRAGRVLGRVEHLMEAGAGLLLAVIDAAGVERLIPFQPGLVSDLDPAGGRLVVDPPPGLLDL
jgi:16S rRNA processing protein RimM